MQSHPNEPGNFRSVFFLYNVGREKTKTTKIRLIREKLRSMLLECI